MPIAAIPSYAAAYFSLIVAVGVLLRDRDAFVHRIFAAGMCLFALEELFRGLVYSALLPDDIIYWQKRVITVSVLIPSIWLAFSLTYARVNPRKFLAQWKWPLLVSALAPIPFLAIFRKSVFLGAIYLEESERWSILLGSPGRWLQMFFILMSVLILFNLERTMRSSVGRMRWQIKFLVLGIGGLFALRIYTASQALLFSTTDTGFGTINAVALIAADSLFAIALFRGSSLTMDVYLSGTAIQNSLTLIFAGIYLIAVGLIARVARSLSPNGPLPYDTFIVFIALTAFGALLLSNRVRRQLRLFVSRHFHRPIYDYRRVWMELTQRTRSLVDVRELSSTVSRLVSEWLEILSVSVWVVDESQRKLMLAGSTAFSADVEKQLERAGRHSAELIRYVREHPGCIDLQEQDLAWPGEVMSACPEFFRQSKLRYVIGLRVGEEIIGVLTLNDDRVGYQALTTEDMLLLESLADHLAASLLNLRSAVRLRHAKEVETFQAVSTFFVHDLKNLASRLSLTMQNLPANFDNPEFRADALRVMSASVTKIDDMCARLSLLREQIELKPAECDLRQLVESTLAEFKGSLKADLKQELQAVPKTRVDSEQIHKVLTNLVMNANEALNGNGVIQVATIHEGDTVGFLVRDNGCGMSQEFIEKSLFKPFQTTKKRGLGIGLFHSKLIVEAHHGTFEVNSTVGAGTEFRVILPIAN
ncbi:MAG TPA: XrtA/PEP-CTERM system histidine kinase PrsK [Terriglobia bacterium]|jgi:putative PEP-CTERM system histidine kinase